MMYKLFNKLFGWDYIYWENSCDEGITRVYKAPDGTVYYWRYRVTKVVDKIIKPEQVMWLTCTSDKYIDISS